MDARRAMDDSLREAKREFITDSAWFWFALFTGVGLAALLATGGKFGERQANIENKYQARSAVASGSIEVHAGESGEKRSPDAPQYSTPDKQIIPLWPLEVVLGLICALSLAMLLRQRFG